MINHRLIEISLRCIIGCHKRAGIGQPNPKLSMRLSKQRYELSVKLRGFDERE